MGRESGFHVVPASIAGVGLQLSENMAGAGTALSRRVEWCFAGQNNFPYRPRKKMSRRLEEAGIPMEINEVSTGRPLRAPDWRVSHPARSARVRNACAKLLSDLSAVPSLEDLVRALGTNRNTLTREFNSAFGQSVYSWLREQRLLHARRLLTETDWPIARIGEAVGYADANHFSTSYRRRFGLSPRQQRQAMGRGRETSEENEDLSEAF